MGLVVAFDIDDTLGDCATATIGYFNRIHNKNITVEYVSQWVKDGHFDNTIDIYAQLYDITEAEVYRTFREESDLIAPHLPFFEAALNEAWRMIDKGHTVVYITARDRRWREVSESWLDDMGFPKGEVYCTENKADLALSLGVAVFYEDNVKNILSLIKVGIKCFMIDSVQNSWIEIEGVERLYWNQPLTALNATLVSKDAWGA